MSSHLPTLFLEQCYPNFSIFFALQILDNIIDSLQMGRDCLTLPRKRTLEEIVKNPLLVSNDNLINHYH